MDKIKNIINTPWEDDEIEFVKGNWKIERSDCVGLYRYSVSGIEGQCEVDAVQLIQWNMAKVRDYPTLHPWDNADITFLTDGIIRDPRDKSNPKGKRNYLLEKDGKILCVNKYYLVQNGLANYGAKTAKEISMTKLSTMKVLTNIAWEEDEIIIVPQSGVTVAKAHSVGMYRVSYGGITSVRSAEFLVQNGYAERKFDVQLRKISKCTDTTIERIGKDLHGFWYSEDPKSIVSLRQIAKLSYLVESGDEPFAAIVTRCENKLSEVSAYLDAMNSLIVKFNTTKTKAESLYEKCNILLQNKILPFDRVNLFTFCTNFFADYDECRAVAQKAIPIVNTLSETMSQLETLYNKGVPNIDFDIDTSIFPQSIVDQLQEVKNKLEAKTFPLKTALSSAKTVFDNKQKIKEMLDNLSNIIKVCENTHEKVQNMLANRAELDKLVPKLGDKAKRKKIHIVNKTYKPDGIKFTTAMKIKHVGFGKYELTETNETRMFSAEELVYLKLAKYI